jgi:hypothetical protein
LGDFFGKKEVKKQQEIIKKQDDFEIDPEAQITILNQENSPDYIPFDAETDIPDFKVNQWKFQSVSKQDIESTYANNNKLSQYLNETYQELTNKPIEEQQYSEINLHDLKFRFDFAKLLQQKLGFDISDYLLSKSHTVEDLYQGLNSVVTTRWMNERNPNGIVLRLEDFSAPNVYLNEELSQEEQDKKLHELADQARASE